MKRVYIAGPYTGGDVGANVHEAMEVASALLSAGYAFYCPHLSHFVHIQHPQPYERWMALDIAWLEVCAAVIRIPGHSPGADREVEFAVKRGIPVVELNRHESWLAMLREKLGE